MTTVLCKNVDLTHSTLSFVVLATHIHTHTDMTAITVQHIGLWYDCIFNILLPSSNTLTVNMRKACLCLYQTPQLQAWLGDLETQVLTHLLSLFWDVPRMVFYISKEENIPMLCSKPLSWSPSITVSALHGHTYLCHTFHSSQTPLAKIPEQNKILCSPLLGCTSLPEFWSIVTCSAPHKSASWKRVLVPFVSCSPNSPRGWAGNQLPAISSLHLSLFCSFLNNNNNKSTKHV